jgi:hypothetical protein
MSDLRLHDVVRIRRNAAPHTGDTGTVELIDNDVVGWLSVRFEAGGEPSTLAYRRSEVDLVAMWHGPLLPAWAQL